MPMDFPDMKSLKMAAQVHGFRQPRKGEKENWYRAELANHVAKKDFIESEEIRNKVGWDKWNKEQNEMCVLEGILRSMKK